LLASYNGPSRIFLIDEAQHLSDGALEWVRGLCEEVGCKLVFSGNEALVGRFDRQKQLASRLVRPVQIRRVSDLDAETLGLAHGIKDRAALALLRAIAPKKGGLRNVANVIDLARLYAGANEAEGQHVNQALIALRLGSADQ
jgi:DNA transposition AAA+ family ATPase